MEAAHEVTVVTCAPNVPAGVVYPGYGNPWCVEERVDGIRVVRVWTFLAPNRGVLRRTASYGSYFLSAVWRSLRLPRPDVVVATSPQFFCGWAGVWAARLARTPLVLEIRDLWPESIEAVEALGARSAGLPRRALLGVLAGLERRMYGAARLLITVGDGYRESLLARGVEPARVAVVTNGVEGKLFQPREPDAARRAEAGAREGDFLVGYVGTLGLAHGLEVVCRAGRIARERGIERLKFVLVGDGARRVALEDELARDDPGNVRILGLRPKVDVPGWLASLDACLVHLRDADTFATVLPSKIFEALAMERPVLLGLRGHARRTLEATGGGVAFDPEDPAQLVASARDLMDRGDRGRSLGRAGRAAVLRGFDLDALARRYLGLLEAVRRRT